MKYFCWPCTENYCRKIKLDGIQEIRNICRKNKKSIKK